MQSANGFYTLSHLVLFRQYYADGGFAYGFWDASLRYDAVLVEWLSIIVEFFAMKSVFVAFIAFKYDILSQSSKIKN